MAVEGLRDEDGRETLSHFVRALRRSLSYFISVGRRRRGFLYFVSHRLITPCRNHSPSSFSRKTRPTICLVVWNPSPALAKQWYSILAARMALGKWRAGPAR